MNEIKVIQQQEVLGRDFKVYGTVEEPLFLAKDVAEWIEYPNGNISNMLRTVDEEEKLKLKLLIAGQNRETMFLTEDGLYEVLMQSRKPIAKEFKKKVKQILKSIRTGSYQKPLSMEQMMRVQLGMVDSHEERIDKLENTMNIDYAQQKELKKLVGEVVVNALGGKKAEAYKHRATDGSKICNKVFSRIWHDFYDYFNINAYANLPRVKYYEALEYINRWNPPTNMQLEIGNINRGYE